MEEFSPEIMDVIPLNVVYLVSENAKRKKMRSNFRKSPYLEPPRRLPPLSGLGKKVCNSVFTGINSQKGK